MHFRLLDNTGFLLAWLTAITAAFTTIALLWLSRYQPIEMDLAMMHYTAFLINEKNLLLYRDIFENNLPGPFLFHSLIGNFFGYKAQPVRFLDAGVLFCIFFLSWKIISPISKPSAILAPSLFAAVYFLGGTIAAFQRDYIAIVPIASALALVSGRQIYPTRDALLIGALSGLACGFKPNFIVVLPALYWLLLLKIPGDFFGKIKKTILPTGMAFTVLFLIPFAWALNHADLHELVEIYKTYTPVYVSSRTDLYQYANQKEQLLDLFRMQASHLTKLAVISIPGILWTWRQQRQNSQSLKILGALSLITFAIAWHEVIAGKFWFAHLLPPYFFGILCFSLLLTPVRPDAAIIEKCLYICLVIAVCSTSIAAGFYSTQKLYDAGYTADNRDIRSKKIARFLEKNLRPGDKVQSLDGSGDGQGGLLLAKATTATRFVEDIPLYMQPDAAATKGFRHEFIETLSHDPPKFFVYIHNFFHPAGGNRLKEFKELNDFIEKNYDVAEIEDGEYTIFQRK